MENQKNSNPRERKKKMHRRLKTMKSDADKEGSCGSNKFDRGHNLINNGSVQQCNKRKVSNVKSLFNKRDKQK